MREARYKDTKTGHFNGVHLFGPSGVKSYTKSLLSILDSAKLVRSNVPKYYDEFVTVTNQSNGLGRKRVMGQIKRNITPTQNRFSVLEGLGNY